MFGVVSRNFAAARHPFRKQVSGCIQSTSFGHRNHFFVFRNEHAQSTTLGPKLMFRVVSRNFITARHSFRKRVSGCIQSTSFGHRNHFFVFRNEHAKSTTLGPKLMFGVVSRNFVAARHPFRKRVSGCIQSTSFGHRNHFFVFSQRTCQIHYFRSKTHVSGGFAQFRCRTSPIPRTSAGVHTKHGFWPPKPFLHFSQRTCPIHYFRSKTHVWGAFAQFHCRTSPIRERVSGCLQSTSFVHRNHFFVFRNEHAQSTTFGPKLMFGGGYAQFHCRTSPIPKTGVGVHTKHEFWPPEPFLRFLQRTCPIHYFRSKQTNKKSKKGFK
jgi:hypothetical protein